MTNREQAKRTMYGGIKSFINQPANATVLDAFLPFATEKAKFIAAEKANADAAAKTGTNNSGFSQEKLDAKIAAATRTAILAGFAQIKLEDDGELDLAGQLDIAVTNYTGPADSEAAALMQGAYGLMDTNIGLLTGYVTAGDLTGLQDLINEYTGAQGSSDSAHQAEPVDTATFKTSFAPVDKSIKRLKTLGRFLIGTDDEGIYEGLLAVSNLPAVNIHHTTVNITSRAKENSSIINNATAGLSNTDKQGSRDFDGVIHFDRVRNGKSIILTVNAPGRKQVQIQIGILAGKDNNFDVMMEAE
jgi:hypothetical protein